MEIIFRVGIVFIYILITLRVIGKREFAELSAFDLVMLLLIPEIVSRALGKNDYSMTNALAGISTLLFLVLLTSVLCYRFKKLDHLIQGTPTPLFSDGKLIPKNLNRERIPSDEIHAQLRIAGVSDLNKVKWIVLETDGQLSVVPLEGTPNPKSQKDTEL